MNVFSPRKNGNSSFGRPVTPVIMTACFLNSIISSLFSKTGWKNIFLIALGIITQSIMFIAIPPLFGGADPMDHLRNAFYISGNKELGCLVPWRPLGPAALWVALGVTTLKTWKILLAFHFLLGALLPWLIYQLAEKNLIFGKLLAVISPSLLSRLIILIIQKEHLKVHPRLV